MSYLINEVIDQLKKEHREGYVYRGQPKEWPSALVPSLFRHTTSNRNGFSCEEPARLRKLGKVFVEEDVNLLHTLPSEQFEYHRRRLNLLSVIREALGYPMSNIFAQQAGMGSEGLDVTADIEVAAFFAIHAYQNGAYCPVKTGTGIIYRFEVTETAFTLDAIKRMDFYSCPGYLPSYKIISLFKMCKDLKHSFESIKAYREQIGWGLDFNVQYIKTSRPFETIKLPKKALKSSRILNQAAGLLIPDMILSEWWLSEPSPPPPELIGRKHAPCIEDFSQRPRTSKFYFKHHPDQHWQFKRGPEYYFPKTDIACDLVRGWFVSIVQNPYGTPVILLDDGPMMHLSNIAMDSLFERDPAEDLIV
ncbi:MAG: FRG domain-containing protein [Candidatus Aminicenantes bacterium]|nr:MAG: FRG domain-containing protein [Candidatus Aminicenantes bacterium]